MPGSLLPCLLLRPPLATITLEIAVTDELAGKPVAGTIQVGDQVIGTMSEATVKLPANDEQVVTAPGYEVRKVGIRPHVKSSKVLRMPVRLVRRQPDVY